MPSIHRKWFAIVLLLSIGFNTAVFILLTWLNEKVHLVPEHSTIHLRLLASFVISQNLLLLPGLYWFDKHQSKRHNKERIPELVLHMFALLGGGIGALFGQTYLRHKTQKPLFKYTAWLGIALLGYVGYKSGATFLS